MRFPGHDVFASQVLSEAFKDSDPATPIYFILSAGANVTADVDKLADKHSMEKGATYHDISLGQVIPPCDNLPRNVFSKKRYISIGSPKPDTTTTTTLPTRAPCACLSSTIYRTYSPHTNTDPRRERKRRAARTR